MPNTKADGKPEPYVVDIADPKEIKTALEDATEKARALYQELRASEKLQAGLQRILETLDKDA